jgi:hypothetical protein
MNVDYAALEDNILNGSFKAELEAELTIGFRTLAMSGERLPVASHYASQIAEIVSKGAPEPMRPELAYQVYLEILAAVEAARAAQPQDKLRE